MCRPTTNQTTRHGSCSDSHGTLEENGLQHWVLESNTGLDVGSWDCSGNRLRGTAARRKSDENKASLESSAIEADAGLITLPSYSGGQPWVGLLLFA